MCITESFYCTPEINTLLINCTQYKIKIKNKQQKRKSMYIYYTVQPGWLEYAGNCKKLDQPESQSLPFVIVRLYFFGLQNHFRWWL